MPDFIKSTGTNTTKENPRKKKGKYKSETTITNTSDGTVQTVTTKSKDVKRKKSNPKSKTRRVFKSFDSDGNVIQKNVQKIVTRNGRTKKTNYNTKRQA
jgi:hypothetical protein